MDHLHILGTSASSVILKQNKSITKRWNMMPKYRQKIEAKRDGLIYTQQ